MVSSLVEEWPHASQQRDPRLQRLPDTGPYGAPGSPGLFIAAVFRLVVRVVVWLVQRGVAAWRRRIERQ